MFENLKKIFIIFFLVSTINAYAIENKIVVQINEEIITSYDIANEIRYLKILNPSIQSLDNATIEKIAKNSIIREKIKAIEIKNNTKNLKLNKKYLSELLENIYLSINLKSIDQFEQYLLANNLDIKFIENKISIEAIWNELILVKFSSKVKVNKEDLKTKIEMSKNNTIKSYDLLEIVFDLPKKSELNFKYEIITNDIEKKGFSSAALIHSISGTNKLGGKLGWIDEKSISQKIKNEIDLLNIGEYSNPIIIPGGVLILKLEDIKETKVKFDLKKEMEKLIKIETNKQLNQLSILYYNKIKKNININEL